MPAVPYIPRYKIEDYLLWEGDWELWDGVPVAMSPSPNLRHQRLSRKIALMVDPQLEEELCQGNCELFYETDWHVDAATVVRPDLLVACGEDDSEYVEATPTLTVEILSPSTRSKDLIQKRELYASNGVAYYLILDPDEKSALLLQLDEEGTYREIPPAEPFELHPGCRIQLDPPALFA